MNTITVLMASGEKVALAYPSVVRLNHVVLGTGGVLLDVEVEVTREGWIARSQCGSWVEAEVPGKLRDQTMFVA